MLNKTHYRMALEVQDACNLSGVLRSWYEIIQEVWDQAHFEGEGTDWVNRHPINVLFSDKVASLTESNSVENFSQAYEYCQDKVKKASM